MIKKIRFLLAFLWAPTSVLAQNPYEQNAYNMYQPVYSFMFPYQNSCAFAYGHQGPVYPRQQGSIYQKNVAYPMHGAPYFMHGGFYQGQVARGFMQPSPVTSQVIANITYASVSMPINQASPVFEKQTQDLSLENKFIPYVYSDLFSLRKDFVNFIAESQIDNLNAIFSIGHNKDRIDQTFVNDLLSMLFMKKKGISLISQALNYLRQANLPLPDYTGWDSIVAGIAALSKEDRHSCLRCGTYLPNKEKGFLLKKLKRIRDKLEKQKIIAPPKKKTVEAVTDCIFEQKKVLEQDENDFEDLLKMAYPSHLDCFKTYDFFLFEEPNNF